MSIKYKINFINKSNQVEDMFCSICTYPFLTKEDFETQENYSVCHDCFLKFAEARKQEWKKGWRPSKSQIKDHIYQKDNIFKNIKEK